MKNPTFAGQLKKRFLKNKYFSEIYYRLHFLRTNTIRNRVVRKLQQLESLPESAIAEMQEAMLQEVLDFAYKTTDYYRKVFHENGVLTEKGYRLERIPILNKDIIRNNYENLISSRFNRASLHKNSTGGSTGQPLEFESNKVAGLRNYGHHAYLYSLMGYKKGDMIISCGGFPIGQEKIDDNIFWVYSYKDNLFGEYRFSVLYLDEKSISYYVDKILSLEPSILRGYPSFYDQIATFIRQKNIRVDFQVKGINLTSELCTEAQRNNIEAAFKSQVFFEYGHKEISVYCYSKDRSYEYQSSPIYGYVEVLDEDNKPTEIGEVGRIITTGFLNRGMPFIRYDTGDLGLISYRNAGVVKFKKIVGRQQDFLYDKTGKEVFLIGLVGAIYTAKLKAFKKFKRWQIYQNTPGFAEIRIIKKEGFSHEDELEILDYYKRFENIDFSVKYVEDIPKTKAGKHLFVLKKIQNTGTA